MSACIRLACDADLESILAISNHYALTTPANFAIEPESIEQWQRDFAATSAKYPWLVAEDRETEADGRPRVVGFAKASPWKGRCAYAFAAETTVYVAPGQHRRGIGRALYAELVSVLTAQGYRTLLGGITLPNDASVALHESFGYRQVAELKRVGWKFDRWHDVGYWELMLGDPGNAPRAIRHVNDVARERSTSLRAGSIR